MSDSSHTVDSFRRLEREIVECKRCPRLVDWRESFAANPRRSFQGEAYWARPVPGFGDPSARLDVVGLAPAAHGANRTGRMFTGDRSGDWLFDALFRAGYANQPSSTSADDGLVLSGVWVSATVHCAPPSNKPSPEERDACMEFFSREIDLLTELRVIVVLGRFAHQALSAFYDIRPRPRFSHLAEFPLPDEKTMLCSYHPSQQNTFTKTLTKEMFDAVFERARELGA
ncbi:MAG: uracil-DNA glycosylase [Actinobacteria bacterium]|nr:uracil-DNA glycosylase [Actinomycetota bacterium]MCL5445409.1 uracil-DNA glycosylase [Actinomycetota bacterium]